MTLGYDARLLRLSERRRSECAIGSGLAVGSLDSTRDAPGFGYVFGVVGYHRFAIWRVSRAPIPLEDSTMVYNTYA